MDKGQKAWMVNLVSILLIIGIFILASLMLINVGIGAYKNIVLANNDNFQLRTSLSYVATKVRQTDTARSMYMEEKEGVPVLVLGEEIRGTRYETLIYHYKGYLCELYREAGMDYDLSYGIPAIEIDQFDIKLGDDGYLQLTASNKAGEMESLVIYPRTAG
ncbi:MAG TPA: DUF4860 domain-containing protein [Clostridiales bacterium]|nr:DUF4860 domain-containing protein [Clostridiales bacterium]